MSRHKAPRGGLFRGTVVALAAALLGALGFRCRPDKLLDDHRGQNLRTAPSSEFGHGTSKKEPSKDRGQVAQTSQDRGPTSSSIHLAMGVPTDDDPSDDILLLKPQYALSYNPHRNVANWVSSNLNQTYFGDAPRHKGKFLTDDSLPSSIYHVRDQDYVGSGYDRGHMVRSEERTRTPEDNTATFFLTNVLPQRHDLNAGPWLRLEDYCQELSQKAHRELFIMTGGVFSARPETIGHGVAVPEACFKIVVVLERGQGARDVTESTRVISVIMPNTTGILDQGWGQYRTTLREVERKTGYRFLSAVSESAHRALEGHTDTGPTSGQF